MSEKYIWKWERKSSKGNKKYTVSLRPDGEMECGCLAWTRRRLTCRHIKEVVKESPNEIGSRLELYGDPGSVEHFADKYGVEIKYKLVGAQEEPERELTPKGAKGRPAKSALDEICKNAPWRLA